MFVAFDISLALQRLGARPELARKMIERYRISHLYHHNLLNQQPKNLSESRRAYPSAALQKLKRWLQQP